MFTLETITDSGSQIVGTFPTFTDAAEYGLQLTLTDAGITAIEIRPA